MAKSPRISEDRECCKFPSISNEEGKVDSRWSSFRMVSQLSVLYTRVLSPLISDHFPQILGILRQWLMGSEKCCFERSKEGEKEDRESA